MNLKIQIKNKNGSTSTHWEGNCTLQRQINTADFELKKLGIQKRLIRECKNTEKVVYSTFEEDR